MIGIIGAMDEEVAKIVEVMEIERQEDKACMSFKAGKLNGKDVVVVRSGIGKVNAAVCTQILADDFGVDYVIKSRYGCVRIWISFRTDSKNGRIVF